MTYSRTIMFWMLLVLALISQTGHSAVSQTPEYDLDVSFDIPRSKIAGLGKLRVLRGKPLLFQVGRLTIHSVRLNHQRVDFQLRDGTLSIVPPESGTLEIRYEGVFEPAGTFSGSHEGTFPSVIGRQGIFLTAAWYPQIEALANYRLKAALPPGYVAVSEAERIEKVEQSGGVTFIFEFEHPLDGINFVATDRYQVTQDRFHGIELFAYFFPEDQALARRYLDYAKRYIQLYEKLLLPFPFKRFAIVENFLPTGTSMPTYTLLGQDVVRLPFIVETSLGHEILHQWFGNQVYVREERGNWAEGLTTYLADHLYEEQRSEGWRYRKQILIDYASYVRDDGFPLKNFTHRFNSASRSIGYGKSAMVFHMLRQMTGDDAFFGALRGFIRQNQFQRASWDDLKNAFEEQSGRELAWFFNQWIERKGLPELQMRDLVVGRGGSAFVLSFDLVQKGEIYKLEVPVTVFYRSDGEKKARVRLDERKKSVRIDLEKEPSKVVIDEDFDIARKLAEPEVPAVIASLLGNEKLVVVRPVRDESYYHVVIEGFRARGAEVRAAESLNDAEIQAASLLLLGRENPVVRRLYGSVKIPEDGFNLTVKKNPWNPTKAVGIVSTDSAAEAKAAFPKIFHYGKYSTLRFEKGLNVSQTIEASERGIQKVLSEEPTALDLSTLKRLSDVMERLATKKIIYVGETHDKFSHHEVQLQVLQGLYRQHPKIAVGMEMFQRPFQNAIDDYIAGAIDERTFLKRSEYFKRWDVDYNLYKPILDFAKTRQIPVVALNLRREIVEKVAKGGLDSLSKDEKQEIPQELDFSDQGYRARLEEVFTAHQNSQQRNFVFFYQAQILWDETMAESIDRFLKKNPDFRLVVVAGGGHLQYGSGIPKRTFRRNGFDYAIVLNDAEVERGIADIIVFPEPSRTKAAPKLMVFLKEQDQKARIAGFVKDSVSEKAGLKVEDTLLSLDGYPVESIEDVKIALFYKKAGETIKVKIRRAGFFYRDEELEFEVKLP